MAPATLVPPLRACARTRRAAKLASISPRVRHVVRTAPTTRCRKRPTLDGVDFHRRFRHPLSRQTLQVLIAVSAADGLLLLALVAAAVNDWNESLVILGPTHGTLFVILVVTLAVLAQRGLLGWRFVVAVMILGPLASIPGLELYRRGQRR